MTSIREPVRDAGGIDAALDATVPSREDLSATGKERAGYVGARIRTRREASGVSLRQFARQLGVSASFLSQLETGKAQPSVATLYSICAALDMSIDDLFVAEDASDDLVGTNTNPSNPATSSRGVARVVDINEGATAPAKATNAKLLRDSPLVSPPARKVLTLDSGVTWERLTSLTTADVDFLFVRYDVGGSSNADGNLSRHGGLEYGYVLRGELEVNLGFEVYRMGAGDAISFDSTTPHRFTNVGDVPVEAIWFTEHRSHGTSTR